MKLVAYNPFQKASVIALLLTSSFFYNNTTLANQDMSFSSIAIGESELLNVIDKSAANPSKQENGRTIKYFFGYNLFNNMPLSLGYLDMGANKIKTKILNYAQPQISKTEITGVTLDIGYEFPVTNKFSITAGVGTFAWKSKLTSETPDFTGGVFNGYSTISTRKREHDSSSYLRFKYMADAAEGWALTLERYAIDNLDSNVATIGYFEHY